MMGRVQDQIDLLKKAEDDVRRILQDGPVKNGEMLDRLGEDLVNFQLTKMIGDGAGSWDGSPHQLALSDLIDAGAVVWWRDAQLNVWYSLKMHAPEGPLGEDFPELAAMTSQLDAVCNLVGYPRYDDAGEETKTSRTIKWAAPFPGVREIDDTAKQTSVSLAFNGRMLQIDDHDYVVGAGGHGAYFEVLWDGVRELDKQKIAREILKALSKAER